MESFKATKAEIEIIKILAAKKERCADKKEILRTLSPNETEIRKRAIEGCLAKEFLTEIAGMFRLTTAGEKQI